jgi:hypothetical protein
MFTSSQIYFPFVLHICNSTGVFVFYNLWVGLILSSVYCCLAFLSGNTSILMYAWFISIRFAYALVDSKGFWRWRLTQGITWFLDFGLRPIFYRILMNTKFWKLNLCVPLNKGVCDTSLVPGRILLVPAAIQLVLEDTQFVPWDNMLVHVDTLLVPEDTNRWFRETLCWFRKTLTQMVPGDTNSDGSGTQMVPGDTNSDGSGRHFIGSGKH